MTPRIPAILALALGFAVTTTARAQTITQPFSGDNQKASVTQWIGPVKVTIDYSSPDVHGPGGEDRAGKIYGEGAVVPYGLHDLGFNNCKQCPWRAGANQNTVFQVSHDVLIEGQKLKAGSYGLFMIADAAEWTVIFSNNSTSWGAYTYDPAEDALRVKVKPVPCEHHEWLTYEFTDRMPDHATVALAWERLSIPIRIQVENVDDLYVAQIKRELRNRDGYSWDNWVAAAEYCLDKKTHLADGLWFAEQAVGWEGIGVANFRTLTTLARLQIANGKKAEAEKTIARAMTPEDASVLQMHTFARGLQNQGEKEMALTVFQANAKKHPNVWPVNLGLARGYAVLGDKKKAVTYARKALPQAPDDVNRKNIETLIQQWEAPAAASTGGTN